MCEFEWAEEPTPESLQRRELQVIGLELLAAVAVVAGVLSIAPAIRVIAAVTGAGELA